VRVACLFRLLVRSAEHRFRIGPGKAQAHPRNQSAEARILAEAVERRVDPDLEGARFVSGDFRLQRSERSFSRSGIDIPFG